MPGAQVGGLQSPRRCTGVGVASLAGKAAGPLFFSLSFFAYGFQPHALCLLLSLSLPLFLLFFLSLSRSFSPALHSSSSLSQAPCALCLWSSVLKSGRPVSPPSHFVSCCLPRHLRLTLSLSLSCPVVSQPLAFSLSFSSRFPLTLPPLSLPLSRPLARNALYVSYWPSLTARFLWDDSLHPPLPGARTKTATARERHGNADPAGGTKPRRGRARRRQRERGSEREREREIKSERERGSEK